MFHVVYLGHTFICYNINKLTYYFLTYLLTWSSHAAVKHVTNRPLWP